VLVVVGVVAVVVGLTSGGDDDDTDVTTGATTAGGAELPITYAQAVDDGTEDDHEWGARCDPETGELAFFDLTPPPCVPLFDGDNGGATHRGITAETI
jgi:hypothetical protein